jgi:putative phosphoesterase
VGAGIGGWGGKESLERRIGEGVKSYRVGLIADTHGLLRPAAVQALRGSERIVHAGDIGAAALLDALRVLAPVTAVRGNVDRGAWAQGLPTTASLQIGRVGVYILHDVQALDLVPEAAGFRVVVSGHSHRPSVREQNGVLFVNPGSAGPRRFHLPVSVAILEVQEASVEVRVVRLEG